MKSRRENPGGAPTHPTSAFLLTLIMYSRVLPVDHPLSVRALASCKPRRGAAARNACIWNDRASRVREVAEEEKGGARGREDEIDRWMNRGERARKREMRVMRDDGVDVDVDVDDADDDNDGDSRERKPLTFEF